MKRAWYLGVNAAQVAERAVLIGDPARVGRLAGLLSDVEWIPENRMLRTITGNYRGVRITASAFGMGAPIATIVMHELFDIGVRTFLRIGTAMTLPPVRLGDFVIGAQAVCREGTSQAYVGLCESVAADPDLCASIEAAVGSTGRPWHRVRFASCDAFYRDMFALDPADAARVAHTREELVRQDVRAIDMESSALFAVARALGARAATLCVASVDSVSQAKLETAVMIERETELFRVALDALVRTPVTTKEIPP
jgi:uridine phosphorylase